MRKQSNKKHKQVTYMQDDQEQLREEEDKNREFSCAVEKENKQNRNSEGVLLLLLALGYVIYIVFK
jgi:hypothetical protein